MSELILKEDALNCFHDWIDRYGYEHTADEDITYQRIEALDAVRCCDEDCISRRATKKKLEQNLTYMRAFGVDTCLGLIDELPATQPEIIRCKNCKYWVVEEDEAYCDLVIVVRGAEDGSGFCSEAKRKMDNERTD